MPPAEPWRRRRSLRRQRRHYPRLMSRLLRRWHSGVDSEACRAEGPQRQPVVRRQQRLSRRRRLLYLFKEEEGLLGLIL